MSIMKTLSYKSAAFTAASAMIFAGMISTSSAQAQEVPSVGKNFQNTTVQSVASKYVDQFNSNANSIAEDVQNQVSNAVNQFDSQFSQLSSGSSFLTSQSEPSVKSAPAPSPAPQGVVQNPQRAQNIVNETNAYRTSHGAAPVSTSPELTNIAQDWADHLATTENLEHRPQHWNVYPSYIPAGGENVLQAWYDYSDPQLVKLFADSPSHNEIMLHARAKSVGIGVSTAPSGKIFVVENYGR